MKVRTLVYQGWIITAVMFSIAAFSFFRLDNGPHFLWLGCVGLAAGSFVFGVNLMFYRWVTVFGYWRDNR